MRGHLRDPERAARPNWVRTKMKKRSLKPTKG